MQPQMPYGMIPGMPMGLPPPPPSLPPGMMQVCDFKQSTLTIFYIQPPAIPPPPGMVPPGIPPPPSMVSLIYAFI